MANNSNQSIVPSRGIVSDLMLRARLIFSLMGDRRVSAWAKIIPLAAAAYLFFPADLSALAAPLGLIPGISAIDDAAIIGFASYLFIEVAPPAVVKEYLRQLTSQGSNNEMISNGPAANDDGEIVDGEVTDVTDK